MEDTTTNPMHPSDDRQLSPTERKIAADSIGGDTRPKQRIELRRISFNARLSQETNAYAADIYLDGKKIGDTRNDGGGGSDVWFIPDKKARETFDALIAAMPAHTYPAGHGMKAFTVKMDAEVLFGILFDAWLAAKEDAKKEKLLQKHAEKARAQGFVLLVVSYPDSYIRQPCKPEHVEKLKADILKKHGAGAVRVLS